MRTRRGSDYSKGVRAANNQRESNRRKLCVLIKKGLSIKQMALMKGEPLVRKVALIAKYVVFPGAMAAAVIYSPPTYASYYSKSQSSSSSK
ncbi:hypothetical protein A4A49_16418 [Nicotiana attenuata]|uniref:Uncharacterized protein n=1 Tax=Nicotiana attenuata TaxID=49451 RepID=A0A314KKJ1_NICAT|nr:hypothetical protein A4A49_16418 [Nicotiana attenuata]